MAARNGVPSMTRNTEPQRNRAAAGTTRRSLLYTNRRVHPQPSQGNPKQTAGREELQRSSGQSAGAYVQRTKPAIELKLRKLVGCRIIATRHWDAPGSSTWPAKRISPLASRMKPRKGRSALKGLTLVGMEAVFIVTAVAAAASTPDSSAAMNAFWRTSLI